jgi:hypothetical protein
MRALILALVFLFSVPATAAEFKLNIIDNNMVEHNSEDWELVAVESNYDLYVAKKNIDTGEKYPKVHTMVEFNNPEGVTLGQLIGQTRRIYSFGIMECPNELFTMMNDFFVDKNNQFVYIQNHEIGEYLVEVRTPKTARRAVYERVCTQVH